MNKIKTILLMLVIFISTSSFTTKEVLLAHECVYKLYSGDGTFLGYWHTWVPDDVSCGSSIAKALAIAEYNVWH